MTGSSVLACPAGPDGSATGLGGNAECLGGPIRLGASLRVFEFFSGIGGLREGLNEALESLRRRGIIQIPAEVVGAYDISATANKVYAHNFKASPICVSIEHLSLQQVDGKADLWLLSPPCQPYTRGGKKLDSRDGRATGFLHLLQLLSSCSSPPLMIFLENVRGFEGSDTWRRMQQVLCRQHYQVQHFLLSPTQIGIPNTRVRYYCLACRQTTENLKQDLQSLLPDQQQQHQQQLWQQQHRASVDHDQQLEQQQQEKQPQQQEHKPKQQQRFHGEEQQDMPLMLNIQAPQLQLVPPVIPSGAPGSPPLADSFQARCIGDYLETNIPQEELQALHIPDARLCRFIDVEAAADTETGNPGRMGTEIQEAESGAGHRDAITIDREYRSNFSDTDGEAEDKGGETISKRKANTPSCNSNGFRLEIVSPAHTACGTFTKGYGRNLHSGGPLLLVSKEQHKPRGPAAGTAAAAEIPATKAAATADETEAPAATPSVAATAALIAAPTASTTPTAAAVLSTEMLERSRFRRVRVGETIRFFSSRELLRLHGFPESFVFPSSLPFRKRAALVGNSVNVKVVALLLEHLLLQHLQQMQQLQPRLSSSEQLHEHPM